MSNERKPGYYWAKTKNGEKEIVSFFDHASGGFFQKLNFPYAHFEADFEWISSQTIEDEILGLKYKADELEELLKCEVEKTNTITSRLLKLKSRIKDLTIDDIGRELGGIIEEAVKNDLITKA